MVFIFFSRMMLLARRTSPSVSSRGMSTAGVTWNFFQKNTTSPVVYSIGKSGGLSIIEGFSRENKCRKSQDDRDIDDIGTISEVPRT